MYVITVTRNAFCTEQFEMFSDEAAVPSFDRKIQFNKKQQQKRPTNFEKQAQGFMEINYSGESSLRLV